MAAQSFRAGVVMIVRREDGSVLACERSDVAGSWQLPQGGLDPGETPEGAAWRELGEETGLTPKQVRLVSELPEWIAYEWPDDLDVTRFGKSTRGQVQKWFLFGVLDENIEVSVDEREFRDCSWMDPHLLIDTVIEWRRDAYRRAFSRLLP